MKKRLKRICASVVSVLVLNIILFSILTVVQAPYYDEAPSKVESIYKLYASEEYNEVYYTVSVPHSVIREEEEIQKIETALKSASAIKLNKVESYFRMVLLDKSDFALMTSNNFDREKAKEKIVSSGILVYSKNDIVYIICPEFKYGVRNVENVVYKSENSELVKLLTEYKSADGDSFSILRPTWRQDISRFPVSLRGRIYVLSFFVEFVIALIITRIIQKDQRQEKK
ncbi:MAG: hypothetical protein J6D06_03705 [Clostridia bacterium]|nr:hypothetical protein [Clostridia bacterium]